MNKSLRKELYENVITFPATKSAGALTLTGTVVDDFEDNTFGPTRVLVSTADTSKITDSLSVLVYGSFDEGTTWKLLKRDAATLVNSTGAANATVSVGSLVPRVRADAVFDSSGALAADHVCKVDVIVEEAEQGARKEIAGPTTMAGDLSGAETEYTEALSLATPALLDYAGIAIIVEDSSDITVGTTIGWKVQTSMDGTYWTDLGANVTSDLVVVDTDAPVYIEVEYTANLGKYIRVAITGTSGSALTAANISMYAILS